MEEDSFVSLSLPLLLLLSLLLSLLLLLLFPFFFFDFYSINEEDIGLKEFSFSLISSCSCFTECKFSFFLID